ncbi:MAG: glutathione S-transferase family protein [Proteobacteria bacterium]|nr:glutathione S-transferase family protein [Pseudomonadota bacterium]
MSDLVVWGVGTARTFRAHWALQELELQYETRPVQSRSGETQTPEFRALNPRGKIPVLQDGDFVLAESVAIVSYLATKFGADRGLIPADGSRERALYDQWCFTAAMELDAHTLYVLRRHGDLAALYGEAPAALVAARAYFDTQVVVAAEEIAARGPFLLGDTFTGADIVLGSCLDWALFYGLELCAALAGYRERLSGREAYQRAFQANFPPEVMQALRAQRGGKADS